MILALDIGGTKVASAVVENGVCHQRRQAPTPDNEEDFASTVKQLVDGHSGVTGLAVAVTGYLEGGAIRSVNHRTIPFWDRFPLVDRLQELTGLEVTAINDAQAAAWGEYSARGKQCQNLLFITLSTGVGGGLVLDGSLRVGTRGLAGHIGHASTATEPLDAPVRCGCGRLGCVESVASGTALARQGRHHFGSTVNSEEVLSRAREGDLGAQKIVRGAAQAVAQAIANLHAQVDLELVVLGGSVGLAPGMIDAIRDGLHGFPDLFHVDLEPACLGADAGLIGAAAWHKHLHRTESVL